MLSCPDTRSVLSARETRTRLAVRGWRIQAVVATMGFSGSDSSRCIAWAGVIPPMVLRGRSLSSLATSRSRSGEWIDRSVPFGKYCLSRPFDAPMFVKPPM